jgi:hypothetical protein
MTEPTLLDLMTSNARIEGKIDAFHLRVGRIEKDLDGNGQPGLLAKTIALQAQVSAMQTTCNEKCSEAGPWGFFKPVLQFILGGIGLAAIGAFLFLVVIHPILFSSK